jgi:hypothetical protein
MRLLSKIVALFLVLLSFSTTTYAREWDLLSVQQVITNEQGVCLLIGDRWLSTEGFFATGEGMFVLLNEEWTPLTEALARGDYQAGWTCSRCGYYNFMDGVTKCGVCGHKK